MLEMCVNHCTCVEVEKRADIIRSVVCNRHDCADADVVVTTQLCGILWGAASTVHAAVRGKLPLAGIHGEFLETQQNGLKALRPRTSAVP